MQRMPASVSFPRPPSSIILFSFRLLCALSPSPWLTFHCQQMAPARVPFLFSLFWTSSMSLLFFLSFFLPFQCYFFPAVDFVWFWICVMVLSAEYCCRHVAVCDTLCWFCVYKILLHTESLPKLLKNSYNINVLQWNRSWHVEEENIVETATELLK